MANSKLATYTNITPNNSGKRTAKISKITVHYMVAPWSGKQCADYFVSCAKTGRQASSNYCVGLNGDIAVSVPEDCRAWTSSSEWNDQRAVTIECGNQKDSSLTDAGYKALVALCVDICKRNGITPHYDGTTNGSLTMHRMFASTDCPGAWLTNKIASGQFEKDVKAAMNPTTTAAPKKTTVTWDINGVVHPGDKVKSKSCAIKGLNAIKTMANIPELGGYVPLADITEASDTKDGKCDNYLANTKAKVYLDESTILKIVTNDIVQIKSASGAVYNVKVAPLMKKVVK